jgi:hypothetical protein
VSKWGDDFAGQGARMLAGYFGTGSASARYLDLDQTSRLLSHLVIGEEYKKYETSEYSEHLVFKRDQGDSQRGGIHDRRGAPE